MDGFAVVHRMILKNAVMPHQDKSNSNSSIILFLFCRLHGIGCWIERLYNCPSVSKNTIEFIAQSLHFDHDGINDNCVTCEARL